MEKDDVSQLSDLYLETVKENADLLTDLIKRSHLDNPGFEEEYASVLEASAENIVSKWRKHRKMLRTKVVCDVIPDYPARILKQSLLLDAMVNILDDLYDEPLQKEVNSLYIIELLRTLALFNRDGLRSYGDEVSDYLNKLLCIAILERTYMGKIQNSSTFDEVLRYSIECYDVKSMDVDIFIELPLLEMGVVAEQIAEVTGLLNVLRALHIIFKDLVDLEHDAFHGIETPIMIVSTKFGEESANFISKLVDHYVAQAEKRLLGGDGKVSEIVKNVKGLIKSTIINRSHI